MPTYVYQCRCGRRDERVLPVSRHAEPQACECGRIMDKVIVPAMVFVQPNICYDSPIDGRPITSMKARMDDLARADCVPYDPEIKKDYARRLKDGEQSLERAVDDTIEREIQHMPARKRERLVAELQHGMDVEPTRLTAPAKPIKTEIRHG